MSIVAYIQDSAIGEPIDQPPTKPILILRIRGTKGDYWLRVYREIDVRYVPNSLIVNLEITNLMSVPVLNGTAVLRYQRAWSFAFIYGPSEPSEWMFAFGSIKPEETLRIHREIDLMGKIAPRVGEVDLWYLSISFEKLDTRMFTVVYTYILTKTNTQVKTYTSEYVISEFANVPNLDFYVILVVVGSISALLAFG